MFECCRLSRSNIKHIPDRTPNCAVNTVASSTEEESRHHNEDDDRTDIALEGVRPVSEVDGPDSLENRLDVVLLHDPDHVQEAVVHRQDEQHQDQLHGLVSGAG